MKTDIYSQKAWLEKFISDEPVNALDANRVVVILESVPQEVRTILDVGIGGGYIYRELKNDKNLKCYGMDISAELVKRARDKSICIGDVKSIPFKENSFDLVLAADLLEHVDEESFKDSISELVRVTKKYILINSPYKGTVSWAVTFCNRCKKDFNIYGHTRSVDMKLIRDSFPGNRFEVLHTKTFGGKRVPRSDFIVGLARKLGKVYSREGVLCPFCLNTKFEYPQRNMFEIFFGRLICAFFILSDKITPAIFKSGSEICVLIRKR